MGPQVDRAAGLPTFPPPRGPWMVKKDGGDEQIDLEKLADLVVEKLRVSLGLLLEAGPAARRRPLL